MDGLYMKKIKNILLYWSIHLDINNKTNPIFAIVSCTKINNELLYSHDFNKILNIILLIPLKVKVSFLDIYISCIHINKEENKAKRWNDISSNDIKLMTWDTNLF